MSALIHGGNLRDISSDFKIEELIDFSSNVNPLGPPVGLLDFLRDNLNELLLLPEYDGKSSITFLSELIGIDKKRIVPGNGTTEFIHRLPEILKPEKALIVGPTYSDYENACKIRNIKYEYLLQENSLKDFSINRLEQEIKDHDLIYICNPNNPTGNLFSRDDLESLCLKFPNVNFIIDETYLPFEKSFKSTTMSVLDFKNLYVLLSFSKIFRLPGVRLGFMVGPLDSRRDVYSYPWKIGSIGLGICTFLNENKSLVNSFLDKTHLFIKNEKQVFLEDKELALNLNFINSNNIYTLAEIKNKKISSGEIFNYFLKRGFVIRDCENIKGLGMDFIRFSFKEKHENLMLNKLLKEFFKGING